LPAAQAHGGKTAPDREVNLFVDHSRIVWLEALRRGIWGTKSTWGRIENPAE
jgi:phosphosulfolactate synthase (CoM biosynthesis protein A)